MTTGTATGFRIDQQFNRFFHEKDCSNLNNNNIDPKIEMKAAVTKSNEKISAIKTGLPSNFDITTAYNGQDEIPTNFSKASMKYFSNKYMDKEFNRTGNQDSRQQ